jgi:hypothetical protein
VRSVSSIPISIRVNAHRPQVQRGFAFRHLSA